MEECRRNHPNGWSDEMLLAEKRSRLWRTLKNLRKLNIEEQKLRAKRNHLGTPLWEKCNRWEENWKKFEENWKKDMKEQKNRIYSSLHDVTPHFLDSRRGGLWRDLSGMWRTMLGLDYVSPKNVHDSASSSAGAQSNGRGNSEGAMRSDKVAGSAWDGIDKKPEQQNATESEARVDTRFDAISGRMVPVEPPAVDIAGGNTQNEDGGHSCHSVEDKEENAGPSETASTSTALPKHSSLEFENCSGQLPAESTLPPAEEENEVNSRVAHDVENVQASDEIILDSTPHTGSDASDVPETAKAEKVPPTANSMKQYEDLLEDFQKRERSEDLDLLGASDIRASYSPLRGRQDSVAEKQRRREIMEKEFDSTHSPANDLFAQNAQANFQRHADLEGADSGNAEEQPSPCNRSLGGSQIQCPEASEKDSQREIRSNSRLAADELKTEDNSGAVKLHCDSPVAGEEEHVQTEEQHSEPPKHSQNVTARPTVVYRIIAYDPSTKSITTAETSSSQYAKATNPAEVLSRLNNPAKLIPHLAEMQRDGYEIVAGGRDILVFKNMGESGNNGNPDVEETESATAFQKDMTSEPMHQAPQSSAITSRAGSPIASAESNSEGGRSRARTFGRAVRRMFLAGTATAALCYAIGAVWEFFRTGGKDGRGFNGFTAFEAERRENSR